MVLCREKDGERQQMLDKTERIETDVLVMGAGLAGIMAAVWASKAGVRVCIAANGAIGSGSSFYPGTWGLGLIGPESEADKADLLEVILEIGEGMAEEELASCLVSGVAEGISELKRLGAEIKDAVNKGEREFVPCFDRKCRDWHGIVKGGTKKALLKALDEGKVRLLPYTAVTDIWVKDNKVTGAEAVRRGKDGGFLSIRCRAAVIASGGLGGLFSHRLNTPDVTGMGQFLALKAGASLINLEFMQMMPGFLSPAPQTIYNEKVFRFSEFSDPVTGRSVFADWEEEKLRRLMDMRSGHGPFTSRLESKKVDIRLYQKGISSGNGVMLSYQKELKEMKEKQPEFVKTYFQWLYEEKGLTMDDPVFLGIFAHASNGGIRIDQRASTGVEGLFACGEATGGMHGADRLGGLSTANALVFGKIAGQYAAAWCQSQEKPEEEKPAVQECGGKTEISGAAELLTQVREINYRTAMVVREEGVLLSGLKELKALREIGERQRGALDGGKTPWERYLESRELEAALELSEALLKAALLRKESRGSHYRVDYPEKKEELNRKIVTSMQNGELYMRFY